MTAERSSGPGAVTDTDPVVGRRAVLSVTAGTSDAGLDVSLHSATTVLRLPDGRSLVAIHGPHAVSASAFVRWLDAGSPDPAPVRQGFAAILVDPARRRIRAAVGARSEVAVYYAVLAGRIMLSSHPQGVVDRLPSPPELRAHRSELFRTPFLSPFVGVDRLPAGHMLDWHPEADSVVTRWFRPEDVDRLPESAAGPSMMRETIRDAIVLSLPADGTSVATVSGGLDSTVVAALAAQVLGRRGIDLSGVAHVPLPGTTTAVPGWEASDATYAEAMAGWTPGLHVDLLANDDRLVSLDVLDWCYERTFRPLVNPDNLVWSRQISEWGDDRGAALMLTGDSGNFWFSLGSSSLVRSARGRGDLRGALRLTRQLWAGSEAGTARHRRALAAWRPAFADRGSAGPVGHLPDPVAASASAGGLGAQNTGAGFWRSDPLGDPEVIRLAHALPVGAWAAGGLDRGLAREVGRGLLPDLVRLRTRRGVQAADAPRLILENAARYRAAAESLADSPSACRLVDVPQLRATLDRGLPDDPDLLRAWRSREGRWLALGLFGSWWDRRCAARQQPSAR